MGNRYGEDRVLEPKQTLPTSAWRLDNRRQIAAHEMRVELKTLHLEGTSFRQICLEARDNDEMIRNKIMDIVIRRGKLHNPVTDTGGLAHGIVSEIGEDYHNPRGLQPGEEVLCNASLASFPLHIREIKAIDRAYNQVEVEGHAIMYGDLPVVRKPEGLPVDLLLYTFNESGTLYGTAAACKGKGRFVVVGNNLLMNFLYGHTIRKIAGESAEIICVLDKKANVIIKGGRVDELAEKTFNAIHYVNILHPLDALRNLGEEGSFDLSVNCAEIPGAESLSILSARYGGTVVFTNLINNYNIALYITEAISRSLDIRFAEGYLAEYDEFDIEIVRDLAPYFAGTRIATIQAERSTPKELKNLNAHQGLAEDFIWASTAMGSVVEEIRSVAKYDCNVLITGETGVGKDKVANMIVKNSSRNMYPYIKINCASISPNLMESEFFGYEPGSFTGAKNTGKKGYFEAADNGIVFLDEVGELPLDIQAKLLRVIQDGEFLRVGGTRPIKTNVRILSATNRNLEQRVENKEFRRDLYYRLNVFPIKVPPLRERREDIGPLICHFIKKYSDKFGVEKGIEEDAVEHLMQGDWPGNIRELENVVQRLLIGAKGENVTLLDVMRELHGEIFEGQVPATIGEPAGSKDQMDLDKLVGDFERQIIKHALEKHGSTRKAAKAIGISQTQLVRKKKKYRI